MYKLFIFSFLIVITNAGLKSDVALHSKVEKLFELKAGKAIMKISTYGARIISFKLGENEMITQINENENFGSTLWTAPQSDWGWPPFSTLDKQDYNVEKACDTLKLTSKPDSVSGLQFKKTFVIINNHFIRVEYSIRNISTKEKKLGAWEVTRVPCGGFAFFPEGEKVTIPESSLKINLSKNGINWVSIQKKPTIDNQKSFSSAREGWMAYSLKNTLFIKQFLDTKPDEYSPNQGEVEIYVNKERSYAELENHGKYTLLQPGNSLNYVVFWSAIAIPKSIDKYATNNKLIAFARKRLYKKCL